MLSVRGEMGLLLCKISAVKGKIGLLLYNCIDSMVISLDSMLISH